MSKEETGSPRIPKSDQLTTRPLIVDQTKAGANAADAGAALQVGPDGQGNISTATPIPSTTPAPKPQTQATPVPASSDSD